MGYYKICEDANQDHVTIGSQGHYMYKQSDIMCVELSKCDNLLKNNLIEGVTLYGFDSNERPLKVSKVGSNFECISDGDIFKTYDFNKFNSHLIKSGTKLFLRRII